MKKLSLYCALLLAATLAGPALAQNDATTAAPADAASAASKTSTVQLKDDNAIVSYSVGFQMGNELRDFHNIDLDMLLAGIKDRIAGLKSPISQEQTQAAFQKVMQEVQANAQMRAEEESKAATSVNASWFAENAKKEGVVTGENGLQYKVIKEGEGETPTPADTVTVHYTGKLTDGTVFDSSYNHKDADGIAKPATFQLKGVIPGWTQGLQLMKKGAKYELYIPSDLGYGPQPPPGSDIPANAILIFEVELLDIKHPAGAAANPNEIVLDQK